MREGADMTKREVEARFEIPAAIIDEYESWNLCGGRGQYDERDITLLGMIATLHEIGFEKKDVEQYARLSLSGRSTSGARLAMLDKRRAQILDGIHCGEGQLERLDWLRHEIRGSR